MPSKQLFLAVSAVALMTTAGSVVAADAGKLPSDDAKFVHNAAEIDHMEIAAAKSALGKAQSADVKKYAQTMVDDHTKTSGELSTLASAKGATLPAEPSIMQKGKIKLLSARDGASFDKHYAESMVSGHEDALKMFKKEAASGKDPEVKAWAAKTVPALEHHLQMAKDLKASTASDKKM